jgi:hypothetical protein
MSPSFARLPDAPRDIVPLVRFRFRRTPGVSKRSLVVLEKRTELVLEDRDLDFLLRQRIVLFALETLEALKLLALRVDRQLCQKDVPLLIDEISETLARLIRIG